MYGFEDLIDVAPEQLLQKITQEQIIEWILKEPVDLSRQYTSPFRDDTKPGCRFELRPDGMIIFVDFGERHLTGRTHRTCFGMVMDKFGVSMQGALKILCSEFGLSTQKYAYQEVYHTGYSKQGSSTPTDFTYERKE